MAQVRNMLGRVLSNLADPVDSNDAVTVASLRAQTVSVATGVALGTSAGTVTGLTVAVASGGKYKFRAWLPVVLVGGPTNVDFGLTGPSASAVYYTVSRGLATGVTRIDPYASLTDAATGTSIVATLAVVEGTFTASAAGNLVVRGIRVAGTSATVQVGAFLKVERVA